MHFGGCQFTFWIVQNYILEAEIVLGVLCRNWKATKEYLHHRGTKSEFFERAFRPLFPPLFPLFSPLFPCQALLPPFLPSSPPPLSPFFDSQKARFGHPSDLGTL